MKKERKPERWVFPAEAAAKLSLASPEIALALAVKFGAHQNNEGVDLIDLPKLRRALTKNPKRTSNSGKRQPPKFEMHVGKLQKRKDDVLPDAITKLGDEIALLDATISDPKTLPFDARAARKLRTQKQTKLTAKTQELKDTSAELDELKHLDDAGVKKWYEEHGYEMPGEAGADSTSK